MLTTEGRGWQHYKLGLLPSSYRHATSPAARTRIDTFGHVSRASAPAMLSPFRANYLVACARRLPFDCTRTLTSTSDENKRRFSQLSKPAEVSTKSASDHLPSSLVAHHDSFDEGDSLTAALSHYSSLPPLPPIDKWLSRFPYGAPVVRDRISIRSPESAIRVAQSFINSKKTTTGNPKVVIEAFPGVLTSSWYFDFAVLTPSLGPGALSRALLTLPPSQLKKLIILEDHEPYLEYLRVCNHLPFCLQTIDTFC